MKLSLKLGTVLGLVGAYVLLGYACADDLEIAPSPSLGSIAYVSGEESGPGTSIYIADADGSHVKRLPETDKAMFLDMDRSGQSLMFTSDTEDQDESEIFVMKTDGTEKRQLTKNHASDHMARFSFDGRKIIFVSERDGANEIYIMDADGSHQKRLTFHRGTKSWPRFSPDGKRIAFTSVTPDGDDAVDCAILIVNSDGTNLHRFGHTRAYQAPVWHPNGNSLLCQGDKDFVILPVDGGKPIHLPVQGFSASWSLDGQRIVFNRLAELIKKDGRYSAYYNIYTMSADGQNVQALVSNRRKDNTIFSSRWPCWGGKVESLSIQNHSGLSGSNALE